jgi:hypothetical protein
MASYTDFRHSLLSKAFAVGPTGPIRKLLLRLFLRLWAERYPDDFECWSQETARYRDLLRSDVGAAIGPAAGRHSCLA